MKQPIKTHEQLREWADAIEAKRRQDIWSQMGQVKTYHRRRFEDHEQERLAKHVDLPPIYQAVQYVKDNQPLFAIIAICAFVVILAWNV